MNTRTGLNRLINRGMPFLVITILLSSSIGASAYDASNPSPIDPAAPLADTAVDLLSPVDSLGIQSIASSYFVSGGSAVKAAGANFVHFGIEWDDLAPGDPGDPPVEPIDYNWTAYDAEMDLAASLGYEIMITLGHNPLWAASFRRGPVDCVPLTRFTDYVSAVATRYSASPYNVKYWAIYNEPDVVGFTRSGYTDCSGDSWAYAFGDDDVEYNGLNGPEHYVAHLQAAYNTIKGINADAVVMNGGVAYDFFESEGGYFNQDFLNQIFTAGAGAYMDAMNFHYYPDFDYRWEPLTGLPGVMAKSQAIKDVLTSNSLDKPLVCSELGQSSGFGGADTRTEDTQAIAVVMQFTRAVAAGNKISIWYNMNDYPGDLFFGEHGLLDYPSFSGKLSLDAFETLATIWPGFEFTRIMDSTELGASDLEGYLFRDQSGGESLIILWSADGSSQTITLPQGVTSVVDKFNDPVTYSSTLGIDEQPVFITVDLEYLYLPMIMR